VEAGACQEFGACAAVDVDYLRAGDAGRQSLAADVAFAHVLAERAAVVLGVPACRPGRSPTAGGSWPGARGAAHRGLIHAGGVLVFAEDEAAAARGGGAGGDDASASTSPATVAAPAWTCSPGKNAPGRLAVGGSKMVNPGWEAAGGPDASACAAGSMVVGPCHHERVQRPGGGDSADAMGGRGCLRIGHQPCGVRL
jgi:hypothetical protein